MIEFFVPGVPAPKGSTKAFINRRTGHPIITADNRDAQKAWQSIVTMTAMSRIKRPTSDAVRVTALFLMKRPKSLPKYVESHVKKPDLDKLARCLLDGMTGVVFNDDSQVVGLDATKRYAVAGEMTGCHVGISESTVTGEAT
jgi:Holliday junction resolvase RusA-like endonuclease